MKKHNQWRKARNSTRRIMKVVTALDRKDRARAEWFKNATETARKSWGSFTTENLWYIRMAYVSDWPDLTDAFIEVTGPDGSNPDLDFGVYRVEEVVHRGPRDVIVIAHNVENRNEEHFWFPRTGQRVVPCDEVGDLPWLD